MKFRLKEKRRSSIREICRSTLKGFCGIDGIRRAVLLGVAMERLGSEALDPLGRLEEIGFRRIGEWTASPNGLNFMPDEDAAGPNVLYAFVTDRQVLYVGKTGRTLVRRLYGYRRPGKTQFTNIYCNERICELLAENKPVEVFIRREEKPSQIGSFAISEAAALEDAIIRELSPPWNRTGKGE